MKNKAYMTRDTSDSMSIYEAVGRKWKLIKSEPQGCRTKIKKFLDKLGVTEVDRMYTDEAAYHFYMVLDMPEVKEDKL